MNVACTSYGREIQHITLHIRNLDDTMLTVEQSHKHRRHSCVSVACTSAIVSKDIAKHADGQQSTY